MDLLAAPQRLRQERQRDATLQGRREGPAGQVATLSHAHARPGNPTVREQQALQSAVHAALPLCHEGLFAIEVILLPGDGPSQARLQGGDVLAEILTAQWIAHLQSQGVSSPETAPCHAFVLCQRLPQGLSDLRGDEQLVSTFSRVSGSSDVDRSSGETPGADAHVGHIGIQRE